MIRRLLGQPVARGGIDLVQLGCIGTFWIAIEAWKVAQSCQKRDCRLRHGRHHRIIVSVSGPLLISG